MPSASELRLSQDPRIDHGKFGQSVQSNGSASRLLPRALPPPEHQLQSAVGLEHQQGLPQRVCRQEVRPRPAADAGLRGQAGRQALRINAKIEGEMQT